MERCPNLGRALHAPGSQESASLLTGKETHMEHTRHPYIGHLTIVQAIAQTLAAYLNCEKSGNAEWRLRHRETLQTIIDNFLPSGSGINHGTRLDDRSTPDRIILLCDFHHMSEHGYYDGWTSHQIVITPSLVHDFTLRITGRD